MLESIIKTFQLDIEEINEVDESKSSTVFKVKTSSGKILYIKISYSKVKFHREWDAYRFLKNHMPVPDVVNVIPCTDDFNGAFLLSEVEGEPLSTDSTEEIAYQVGLMHARLHNLKPDDKYPNIQNVYPDWIGFIDKQFYSFAQDVKKVIDESLYQSALSMYEVGKQKIGDPDGPGFIHMDFRPSNIIVKDGNVSGILDFESVRFGATDTDFTKIYRDYLSYDEAYYEAYRLGYSSVRDLPYLDKLLDFYQFTDAFNSIGWCQRRGIQKHKQFFNENLLKLEQYLQ